MGDVEDVAVLSHTRWVVLSNNTQGLQKTEKNDEQFGKWCFTTTLLLMDKEGDAFPEFWMNPHPFQFSRGHCDSIHPSWVEPVPWLRIPNLFPAPCWLETWRGIIHKWSQGLKAETLWFGLILRMESSKTCRLPQNEAKIASNLPKTNSTCTWTFAKDWLLLKKKEVIACSISSQVHCRRSSIYRYFVLGRLLQVAACITGARWRKTLPNPDLSSNTCTCSRNQPEDNRSDLERRNTPQVSKQQRTEKNPKSLFSDNKWTDVLLHHGRGKKPVYSEFSEHEKAVWEWTINALNYARIILFSMMGN